MTGFVLGLLSVLFAWIPIIGVIAWPLSILGLIFAVLGWLRVRKGVANNKGLAIAGTVLSAIGLVVCIAWVSAIATAEPTPLPTPVAVAPPPPAAVVPPAPVAPAPVASAPGPEAVTAPEPEVEAPASQEVTYRITGSGKATSITYAKENFGQEQANGVSLPWSKTVEFPDSGFTVMTVVAQSASGSADNEITCEILRGGKLVTSSSSSGPYAVVTCSGS
ncbi:hypothetical protein H7X46_10410 [Pseudonocardia sp. C8]|uniref:MmpS family transport accessory protein n=1 Tax=Pseudonocardia sp. C8 TaxID=2762759 RepID=UPI001642A7B4|nr:hypothetical protein [Pseudonocardia sp. C8]